MSNNEIHKFLNRNIDKVIEWRKIIEDMLDEPHRYGYADEMLRSIYAYTEDHGDITEAQMNAIENVRRKPSGSYGRRNYYRN
jgi:hypothetical protein